MHRTHLPLCTWIIACHLLATGSKGISSLKLASLLGLQYRTSWHLTHRIRAMMDDAIGALYGGHIRGNHSAGEFSDLAHRPSLP